MKKFTLSDDFASFYQEEGYVVISDAFSAPELAAIRTDIFDLFESRFREINPAGLRGIELMAHYHGENRAAWHQCARRMYDLLGIYRLACKPQVLEVVSKLGLAKPMISTRPEVRTDMPRDEQYTQGWHQDWRFGQGSLNSVTFWVPLHDVSEENGTVEVMPGTHTMGYLACDELLNPRRFVIPEDTLAGRPFFPVEIKQGDALVFSQMLVHRSGYNRSGQPRLTTQIRFVDYAERRFVEQGLPSPVSSDLLWEATPSAADMAAIFTAARPPAQA